LRPPAWNGGPVRFTYLSVIQSPPPFYTPGTLYRWEVFIIAIPVSVCLSHCQLCVLCPSCLFVCFCPLSHVSAAPLAQLCSLLSHLSFLPKTVSSGSASACHLSRLSQLCPVSLKTVSATSLGGLPCFLGHSDLHKASWEQNQTMSFLSL